MIAVIGEALIDLIGSNSGEYKAVVGGANAIVAVELAVRGEPHPFLGRMSSDNFGQMIRFQFAKHGVNLSHSIDAKEQTSLARLFTAYERTGTFQACGLIARSASKIVLFCSNLSSRFRQS